MDRAMIRIRYGSLSSGSHGKAEAGDHGTTVYLLPGLSSGQRKAALRRLRQEASRGCGPELPLAQLTVALLADRLRVGVRNSAAVVRLHPAGSLLPAMLIGGCVTLFVLASFSVRVVHRPIAGGSVGAVGTVS